MDGDANSCVCYAGPIIVTITMLDGNADNLAYDSIVMQEGKALR